MKKIALIGTLVLPDGVLPGGVISIEGDRIKKVFPSWEAADDRKAQIIDYGENYITPGLIDIHIHGARGKDVMDGNMESLRTIAIHQAGCGVTGFVPTTQAAPDEAVYKAIDVVKKASRLSMDSEILGIHLEAPFLNVKKKGAQDAAFIREISKEDVRLLKEKCDGLKVIITVAPEVGRNMEFVSELKKEGFILSIGHSDAPYDLAVQSFHRGITHATHLFNAMSGYHPREPGVIGAVLDFEGVTAEVICDRVHVHASAFRLAARAKGAARLSLITDSMKAAGMGDGIYVVGSQEVVVKGAEARLKENGALAGSVLTLNRAVQNAVEWAGMTVSQAVNMASLNPARLLGLESEMGRIQEGKIANLAVFTREFDVVATILRGRGCRKIACL